MFILILFLITLHPSLITLHPSLFTLHPSPFTLHPSPFTLHPSPFTLHPSPFTLHPFTASALRFAVPAPRFPHHPTAALMPFTFSDDDFDRLAAALGVEPKRDGPLVRFEMRDPERGRRLVLQIQPAVDLPGRLSDADAPSGLVSVYGMNAFLQLQGCTGYIASEELGEAIFFARKHGTTNGLVVERGAGCSLYANVDDRLLQTDFTQLPAEIMMSSVALSMSESLFGDLPRSEERRVGKECR